MLAESCKYEGEYFRSTPHTCALRVACIPPTHPEYTLLGFRGPKQMSFPPSPLEQKGELKQPGFGKSSESRFAEALHLGIAARSLTHKGRQVISQPARLGISADSAGAVVLDAGCRGCVSSPGLRVYAKAARSMSHRLGPCILGGSGWRESSKFGLRLWGLTFIGSTILVAWFRWTYACGAKGFGVRRSGSKLNLRSACRLFL